MKKLASLLSALTYNFPRLLHYQKYRPVSVLLMRLFYCLYLKQVLIDTSSANREQTTLSGPILSSSLPKYQCRTGIIKVTKQNPVVVHHVMLRFGLWYVDDNACQALCMGIEISKMTGGSFCIGTGNRAVICVGKLSN